MNKKPSVSNMLFVTAFTLLLGMAALGFSTGTLPYKALSASDKSLVLSLYWAFIGVGILGTWVLTYIDEITNRLGVKLR